MTPCPRRTSTELALVEGQHHEHEGRPQGRVCMGVWKAVPDLTDLSCVHVPPQAPQWCPTTLVDHWVGDECTVTVVTRPPSHPRDRTALELEVHIAPTYYLG